MKDEYWHDQARSYATNALAMMKGDKLVPPPARVEPGHRRHDRPAAMSLLMPHPQPGSHHEQKLA